MTYQEWRKEEARLKGAVTRARTARNVQKTLAAKLEACQKVDAALEALRQHRLNYFAQLES